MAIALSIHQLAGLSDITPEQIESTEAALDDLGRMLAGSDFEWYLTGGIAIDANLGAWRRSHEDVDLLLPAEALPGFMAAVEPHGYRMMRLAYAKIILDKFVIRFYRSMQPGDLRKLKAANKRSNNPFLRFVDVFLYEKADTGQIVPYQPPVRFPAIKDPEIYTTRNGYGVPLATLEYSIGQYYLEIILIVLTICEDTVIISV